MLDSKATSEAQTASPTRLPSLDGALDASELQSFAYQIANGMVKSNPVTSVRSDVILSTGKMPSRLDLVEKHKNAFPSYLCRFVDYNEVCTLVQINKYFFCSSFFFLFLVFFSFSDLLVSPN